MAITLNGTTGITTPAVTNEGAYTGDGVVFADATPSNTLVTTTGGNVGIGISSPTGKLNVHGGSGNSKLKLSNTASGNSSGDGFDLDFTGTDIYITNRESGFMAFENAGTERMRIDSSGRLIVGDTTAYSNGKVVSYSTTTDPNSNPPTGFSYVSAGNYGGGYFLSDTGGGGGSQKAALWLESGRLYVGTATTGAMTKGVYLANAGTSWTSASDERVKDIIEPITNATQKLSNWRTVIGKYKNDAEGTRRSFLIAQDVLATFPEAVDANVEEELGLKYQDTIPLLVAAIQEQQAIITDLKARIETLENK